MRKSTTRPEGPSEGVSRIAEGDTEKITQDVREYAKHHGLAEEAALAAGLDEKAKEFEAAGAEIYHQA